MRILALALLALLIADGAAADEADPPLRVCADPNNLPLSDRDGAGFENRIAEVIADQLGRRVEYTWWPQRRGFIRNTLKAETCDVLIGVPAGLDMARTTKPYYRSAFAFVTRAADQLDLRSLDDERLARLRIGVTLIGDDGANSPPAHALARRGIVDNVIGYHAIGDYGEASPAAASVRAVAAGEIDVAILWGPIAGPAAKASEVPLVVTPIAEAEDDGLPMSFAIAMAVRHEDKALARSLERALKKKRRAIEKILDDAGVPRLPLQERKR